MLKINEVTLNYVQCLSAVEEFPVIGWRIASDNRNVIQRWYQLQLSQYTNFQTIDYDSEIINSDCSQNNNFDFIELQSSRKYFVRVRIGDNQGEVSDWSESAMFSTGIIQENWLGDFISAESDEDRESSKSTLFRHVFNIDDVSTITSAFLHSTALGLYKAYLNGEQVGNGELSPGWTSYHNHLLYQSCEISNQIKNGANSIGAMVGPGWYKGLIGFTQHKHHYGDKTAFFCQLVINYKNGSRKVIATNEEWLSTDSPLLFSEIYDGELYDARNEIPNWNKISCDVSQWRSPLLISFDKSKLKGQVDAQVKQIEQVAPISLLTTPKGERIIDFGQNMSGVVKFKVLGNMGDRVILKHFEVLDADGNAYFENIREAAQKIEYILLDSPYEQVYQPYFTYHGFRYVKIVSWPGEPKVENFSAVVIHSDMERTGMFESSNTELNRLHENILWGLKSNFVDIPTDCPQRDERLGWTGDAQIFCGAASYLMQTRNFFSKWLTDLRLEQTDERGIPHVIPDILRGKCQDNFLLCDDQTDSAAGWADAAVIIPWTIYLMYGDTVTLRKQYSSMKSWIDFMRRHSTDNVWQYKLQFGDWVALDACEGSFFGATPTELTSMAYYAFSTRLFANIAKVLGYKHDFHEYDLLYRSIVSSYQSRFLNEDGTLNVQTQTAQILSLHFELVPEWSKPKVIHTLVGLLKEKNGHLVTGFMGTPYFCQVLSDNGYPELAWDLLLKDDYPSWLYQVKMGATTIWEHWDGIKPNGEMWDPVMNSFNHYAYGAVGEWMYRSIAGINVDSSKPGFKNIIINPVFTDKISWAKTTYTSIYGKIHVSWRLTKDDIGQTLIIMDIDVPPNTTAQVCIGHINRVVLNDQVVGFNEEVNNQVELGSGSYCIQFTRN